MNAGRTCITGGAYIYFSYFSFKDDLIGVVNDEKLKKETADGLNIVFRHT